MRRVCSVVSKGVAVSLDRDLLSKGYLPEGLPPFFFTEQVAEYFENNPPANYLSKGEHPVNAATYSGSKRGLTRREFKFSHPVTAYDLGRFVVSKKPELDAHFAKTRFSLSTPKHDPSADRALVISSHSVVDERRLERLARYRFIAKTDISRYYHSVYTHSIPWAMHGKKASKGDRFATSATVFCNRLDYILRNGQDGQTIGIPVGPDASRVVSEIICTAIDLRFMERNTVKDYEVVRHVDDIWIGANTHAEAERANWAYREAIREFELDINEAKTAIHSADFRFADVWPSEITTRLRQSRWATSSHRRESLRAALEFAFSTSVSANDDGVLKYVVRALDRERYALSDWETIEPFLKRASVHFGHTFDYVARVLVWRMLTRGDVDKKAWQPIIAEILDRHARLGNDSEVCWALYVCLRLKIKVAPRAAENVVLNCGALSVLALLGCIEEGLVRTNAFDIARDLIATETGNGRYWPLMLEWTSRGWPKHSVVNLQLKNPTLEEMAKKGVSLFDATKLQRAFSGIDVSEFGTVTTAIERSSSYDDEYDEDDGEDF